MATRSYDHMPFVVGSAVFFNDRCLCAAWIIPRLDNNVTLDNSWGYWNDNTRSWTKYPCHIKQNREIKTGSS